MGDLLSKALHSSFIDGDNLHPPANVDKMTSGHPLNDDDREPWLQTIRKTGLNNPAHTVVIACSSLKRIYRDLLRGDISTLAQGREQDRLRKEGKPIVLSPEQEAAVKKNHKELNVVFVYLNVDEQVLRVRMHSRKGHFMGEKMLRSQLATLEVPNSAQEGGIFAIKADAEDAEHVATHAARDLRAAFPSI